MQCLAQNGLDFLRARLVPSEFRTIGEINIDKALIAAGMRRDGDSDTPVDITTEEPAALPGTSAPRSLPSPASGRSLKQLGMICFRFCLRNDYSFT